MAQPESQRVRCCLRMQDSRMILGSRTISQSRMPSIKILHGHRVPHRRWMNSSKLKASRGRVHITKLLETAPNRDLKKLKSHVRIVRLVEKAVCQRAVDVSQETIHYHMALRDIIGKGRSPRRREGPAWKCFLEKKKNARMMGEYAGLEVEELSVTSYAADVTREYVWPRITIKHATSCEET